MIPKEIKIKKELVLVSVLGASSEVLQYVMLFDAFMNTSCKFKINWLNIRYITDMIELSLQYLIHKGNVITHLLVNLETKKLSQRGAHNCKQEVGNHQAIHLLAQ
jgi:hypothetical protein